MPIAVLRARLRGHGYTVYDYPDVRHQKATPPEDHTAYSSTGWPQPATFGIGYAIDIMPPAAGSGLPTLAQLGAQIYTDRQAGLPGIGWLKYMNWEPGDGSCHHDAWQPTHTRRDSTDRGHIHLSGRTDYTDSDTAGDYDPVTRAVEAAMTDLTADEHKWLKDLNGFLQPRVEAFARGSDTIRFGPDAGQPVWLVETLKRIEANQAEQTPPTTAQDIAAALLADPKFTELIRFPSPAELAAELIRQLGGGS
jgi:hypothetical protein